MYIRGMTPPICVFHNRLPCLSMLAGNPTHRCKMPKDLFADVDDDDVEKGGALDAKVRVNKDYATKYDQVKRKQELQRLSSKYGADAAASSSDEESSGDDGSEDDDAHYLTSKKEIAFAEVFHKIRTNPDEILRDKQTRYFDFNDDDDGDASSNEGDGTAVGVGAARQPFRLKDEYQRALEQPRGEVEETTPVQDESVVRKLKPKTAQEKKLRDAFIDATKGSTEEFSVKMIAKGPKPAPKQHATDEKTRVASLLHEAFSSAPSGSKKEASGDEQFLEQFFVNELWKPKEGDGDDSDGSYDWEAMAKEEEDEIFFDEADRWEREYQDRQFRHEDGEAALVVQTFARDQEGQLRKKSTARKEGRKRKESRKEQESSKQVEELKRLKTLKRKEIEEQKDLIAKVAGIKNLEKLGITREFLEKDFDAAEFDKKMAAIFDHDYDHEIDDEEVALFEEGQDEPLGSDEDDEEDVDAAACSDVDDTFADTLEESIAISAAKRKRGQNAPQATPQYLADDELAMLYPDEALRELEVMPLPAAHNRDVKGGKTKEQLEQELEQKVDEYWKLHYHKLAGDVRTRFRYRDVNPESFGLQDIDVLTKDDRQLNMIAPLNCYATYLGKNENTRDRYKAMHRRNTLREVSSDRKSRRYGDVKKTTLFDADMPDEEGQKIAAQIKESTKRLRGDDNHGTSTQEEAAGADQHRHKRGGARREVSSQVNQQLERHHNATRPVGNRQHPSHPPGERRGKTNWHKK